MMANMFAIILTLATFITGILWFLEKFKWKPARQRKVENVRQQTEGKIDGKVLAQVGQPNKWVDNFASFFPVLLIVFVIRSFILEPFQIPSGSMMPTLLVGDFIAVQKYTYGLRDPITNTTIIPTGKPHRGDIVVFKNPNDESIHFVKRVAGLPGDKIVYLPDLKELLIYPACKANEDQCHGQQLEPLDLKYTAVESSEWKQILGQGVNFYTTEQYNNLNLADDNNQFTLELKTRKETLGNIEHDILLLPNIVNGFNDYYKQPGQKPGVWVIPDGNYFMVGDNRDNSDDSRFWGFVPEKNLVGRVWGIWISFEKQPNEWPTSIRLSRIGKVE